MPQSLAKLDRKLPLEAKPSRRNIHDGDEFDIFTQDSINPSKVLFNKDRTKAEDLRKILNDKTEIQVWFIVSEILIV